MNNRIKHMEIQKQAAELRKETGRNYTRKELNIMAKASGIKYFYTFTKHGLAEKLGIELPKTQRGNQTFRSARTVEVNNSDGTITTYPSINNASKALGKPPMYLYVMAVNGALKIN